MNPLPSKLFEPTPAGPARPPLSPVELRRGLVRPDLALDLVLNDPTRLRRAVGDPRCTPWVILLLLASSVVFTLPYALVLDASRAHRIAALQLGAVALCFPSLHVFCSFLGYRASVSRNLVTALLVSAVATSFSLGFVPIVWFVSATTASPSLVTGLNACGQAVSLFAGLVQLQRAIGTDDSIEKPRG